MTLTRAWMKELMYSDCVQRRRVAASSLFLFMCACTA